MISLDWQQTGGRFWVYDVRRWEGWTFLRQVNGGAQ